MLINPNLLIHYNLNLLINDILDFTKLDLGKMKLELYPVKIIALLENIWRTYEFQAKEKGLEFMLTTNIPNGNFYYLDEIKLTQILGNLISNAIKFTEKGKVGLEVTVIKKTMKFDTLLFRIEDTGEGIDSKDINEIFESFYQIKNTITRKKGGTGLGLAIVKSLLKLYGSTIQVSSISGNGSEFTFQIKLKKSIIVAKKEDIIPEKVEVKKILLAEDNTINA